MSSRIALILGAGPNIGAAVASYFSEKEYKVILVCRDASEQLSPNALILQADFTNPSSMKKIFAEVKHKAGIPNLIVYNASTTLTSPTPFSPPLSAWISALNINLVTAFAAIQEAIAGFKSLPLEIPRTFILTGNCGIQAPNPTTMNLGASKMAAGHMIQCALQAHGEEGFRFYFANERNEDWSSEFKDRGGRVHAEVYYEFAEVPEQRPWEFTFVKGDGYVDFSGQGGSPLGF